MKHKNKVKIKTLQSIPMNDIVEAVCHVSGKSKPEIVQHTRKLSMYLCQTVSDVKLEQIKEYYGVGHVGTVSHAIQEVKSLLEGDKKVKILYRRVIDYLNVIQET